MQEENKTRKKPRLITKQKKEMEWDDDLDGNSNRITINNAWNVFLRLSKEVKFCKPCMIYMESCHLGLGEIPQIIANATGCQVRAALGFSNGVLGFPEWSKSKKQVRGHEVVYPDEAADGYKIYHPMPPTAEEVE